MKAHSLLSFTARLQLSKQCLPSWLSSQAWFLVIRVTVCLSAFPALFSSWDWQHIWYITWMYREMIFQSCWICFWSIKLYQKREGGYSTDVLKSYSAMSTSPQACALTPESLVSHRDPLQVYTELWPWNFVWSLFIILLASFHLYLKLFPWLYFRQPLRKYSFFFSEITLPGVAVVPKVVWIGLGLCPMTSQ